MASVIIDSVYQGKRFSVSLDCYLWSLFELAYSDGAKPLLQLLMKKGTIKNSADARREVLKRIVKPDILTAYRKQERAEPAL